MIGIFDSGIGGLSVFREIYRLLPEESYIYFADSAHCPYGEKSREYVMDRAREITTFLVSRGADIITVACNTATAAAISGLREEFSFPDRPGTVRKLMQISGGRRDHVKFIGMEPAVKPAAEMTRSGIIGVLATAGTLNGPKYRTSREMFTKRVKVVEHVGSGFVELVERGIVDGWDDPRMPTLCGLRRRGYTPTSIFEFVRGAGISKVEPAATPAAWSLEPPQSVTTEPSKPHSSRRISWSRCSFSLA